MPEALGTPLAAFEAAAGALRLGDWAGAAEGGDAASLAAFRRALSDALAAEYALAQSLPDAERYMAAVVDGNSLRDDDEAREPGAERHWDRWNTLAGALGTYNVEELEATAPANVFARWLEHAAPARRDAHHRTVHRSGVVIREGPPPPPAPEWHPLEAVAVLAEPAPGADAYVLYRIAGVAPDAPAGRVRVATARAHAGGGWRLVAGPDFLAADEPRGTAAAARDAYTSSLTLHAAADLAELADAEDVIAAEAFYTPGSVAERERALGAGRLYARNAAVFAAYAEWAAEDVPGSDEALKRAAFLSWRAATGFGPRTALADYSDDGVAGVWEGVAVLLEHGALDDEFRAMLGWYYRLAPAFFDYVAAAVPWDGERLRAAVAAFEGVPRLDLVATVGRGSLGRYFAALAAGPEGA